MSENFYYYHSLTDEMCYAQKNEVIGHKTNKWSSWGSKPGKSDSGTQAHSC